MHTQNNRRRAGSTRNPETVIRTGAEHMTITEAHPYHHPISNTDHKGAGVYVTAYEPACPRCRADRPVLTSASSAQVACWKYDPLGTGYAGG